MGILFLLYIPTMFGLQNENMNSKYIVRLEAGICKPTVEKIMSLHVEDYVFIWDYTTGALAWVLMAMG